MNNEKQNSKKWIIIILIIGIALCIGITVWALFFRGGDEIITPDYPPRGTEENQQPIEDDNSEKLESPEGGGAINVTYSTDAVATLSSSTLSVYYANPKASNQNVAILIMIDETVVAKSDLITPGNQVTTLKLEEHAKKLLQPGGYDAQLVVRAYDPESGEKAMIDTKGEITLTVKD